MKNKKLLFKDLKLGMKVIDNDGQGGVITECSDIHNIYIKHLDGGSGFYCLDTKCEDFDGDELFSI